MAENKPQQWWTLSRLSRGRVMPGHLLVNKGRRGSRCRVVSVACNSADPATALYLTDQDGEMWLKRAQGPLWHPIVSWVSVSDFPDRKLLGTPQRNICVCLFICARTVLCTFVLRMWAMVYLLVKIQEVPWQHACCFFLNGWKDRNERHGVEQWDQQLDMLIITFTGGKHSLDLWPKGTLEPKRVKESQYDAK